MNNHETQQASKKNTMTMLEYCKLLLRKISFSQELLNKEYCKGLKYLTQPEQMELKKWVRLNGMEIE